MLELLIYIFGKETPDFLESLFHIGIIDVHGSNERKKCRLIGQMQLTGLDGSPTFTTQNGLLPVSWTPS